MLFRYSNRKILLFYFISFFSTPTTQSLATLHLEHHAMLRQVKVGRAASSITNDRSNLLIFIFILC